MAISEIWKLNEDWTTEAFPQQEFRSSVCFCTNYCCNKYTIKWYFANKDDRVLDCRFISVVRICYFLGTNAVNMEWLRCWTCEECIRSGSGSQSKCWIHEYRWILADMTYYLMLQYIRASREFVCLSDKLIFGLSAQYIYILSLSHCVYTAMFYSLRCNIWTLKHITLDISRIQSESLNRIRSDLKMLILRINTKKYESKN